MAVAGKPYVFINDQLQHYPTIKAQVGGGAKFDHLNRHVYGTLVMPGQLMVVGDESTPRVSPEEAEMMRLAYGTHHALFQHQTRADADIVQNYDLLQQILGYSSLGIGATTGSWEKHLKGVEATLKDIEQLYQLALKRGTPIARQEFINQRRVHFAKLATQLKGIAHWGTGLRNDGSIKKMLGVSTKSYLHNQEIRGYAQRLEHIAKASKLLRAGTPIGIALNAWSTHLEIKEACSTGREEMCRRAKYVEGSKLITGISGGLIGGTIGMATLTPLCMVVFGVPTGGLGAIGCGIVASAIGGYVAGSAGEWGGEHIGEMIYEWKP
ncbi:hypothetical protein [Pseudomonas sp. UBA1879]|uniref:hypothetical protein n=1 Tax=Pseudomonas sp. UBA1879 TaxID=1947305 RepID=UPI0025E554E3|nr:hypothetical protein [Pseudomonas sp. UBA1879]